MLKKTVPLFEKLSSQKSIGYHAPGLGGFFLAPPSVFRCLCSPVNRLKWNWVPDSPSPSARTEIPRVDSNSIPELDFNHFLGRPFGDQIYLLTPWLSPLWCILGHDSRGTFPILQGSFFLKDHQKPGRNSWFLDGLKEWKRNQPLE